MHKTAAEASGFPCIRLGNPISPAAKVRQILRAARTKRRGQGPDGAARLGERGINTTHMKRAVGAGFQCFSGICPSVYAKQRNQKTLKHHENTSIDKANPPKLFKRPPTPLYERCALWYNVAHNELVGILRKFSAGLFAGLLMILSISLMRWSHAIKRG
jgi:hypothetical protein